MNLAQPLTPASLKSAVSPMLARANNVHIFGRTRPTAPTDVADAGANIGWNERLKLSLNALSGASATDLEEANAREAEAFQLFVAGDPKKLLALNALRVQQVINFVVATMAYTGLHAEVINLGNEETPAVQYQSRGETKVRYIGPKGDVRAKNFQSDELVGNGGIIPFSVLSTEQVEYPIFDYQKGTVADSAKKMFDLQRDMQIQIDQLGYLLGLSGYASFLTTGSKYNRTYLPHSNVNTALLPITNDIDISGTTGGKFGTKVLDAALKYCDQWGDNLFEDGRLSPTGEILIPSNVTTDILGSLTLNSLVSDVANEIQTNGYITFMYAGKRWKLIPDSSIQASAGYCFPRLNKPSFVMMFKPGMNSLRSGVVESENRGWSQIVTPIWLYQPEPWRVRQIRIKFA